MNIYIRHKNKIKLYLGIFGDMFDPHELTKLLQLNPIKTYVKGDIIPPIGKTTRMEGTEPQRYIIKTVWDYGSDYVKTLDSEDVSVLIEEAIKDKIPLINDFVKKHNLNVMLAVVPYIDKKFTPSIHFSRSFLKLLSDLNAAIDIDMYIA